MKLLAIDVGVKHLAWCVLNDAYEIERWEVVALAGKTIEQQVVSLHAVLQDKPELIDVDEVVIERQVRANVRMSCIASALLMYFLQHAKPVQYVEASKKLGAFKDFLSHATAGSSSGKGYRRTKAQSVMCTRFMLKGEWLDFFESLPKKDDAADAYTLAFSTLKDRPVRL